MGPSAIRVATRHTARGVAVEVNEQATLKARARFGRPTEGESIIVGRFTASIPLYRVFDGEELRNILDTGEIGGGDYSVAAERAFGSQWGSDPREVSKWGDGQRGQRLGHELFMAEINGQGKVFAHLHAPKVEADVGATSIPLDLCSTGLGCSVQVGSAEVKQWYSVGKGGRLHKVSLDSLRTRGPKMGLKPRKMDLHLGASVKAGPKLAKALNAWMQMKALPRDWDTEKWTPELRRLQRDLQRFYMPDFDMGKKLLTIACKDDCTSWTTQHTRANRDADVARADQISKWQKHFAVSFWIKAVVSAPHYIASPEDALYIGASVWNPETKRWLTLFQSYQGVKMKMKDGRVRFR
jgi:hypothetical protein